MNSYNHHNFHGTPLAPSSGVVVRYVLEFTGSNGAAELNLDAIESALPQLKETIKSGRDTASCWRATKCR
jgi:hypothetical protein